MKHLLAPQLRPMRLTDYPRIRELGLSFSLDMPQEEDWRNLWLRNPLRDRYGDDLPLGWVLETSDGELVGTMGTTWVPYTFQKTALVSAVSRAWFVKTEYRALGLSLIDEYLNQPGVDLFINTAVSVPAEPSFRQFCERVPLGRWDCMSYWSLGFAASASERTSPIGNPSLSIETTDRFDSSFDDFWNEVVRHNPDVLLADRSSQTLTWHFAGPSRRKRLWILSATRNGKLRAYCTLTRQDDAFQLPALPHGSRRCTPAMRLVDYQSLEPGILPAFLQAALDRCKREDIAILENLGKGVPKMQALDTSAPCLEQLSNWKFYYSATDPKVQQALSTPQAWDPSAYDGDASFE